LRVWACANVCNNVRAVSRGYTPQARWDPYVLDFTGVFDRPDPRTPPVTDLRKVYRYS